MTSRKNAVTEHCRRKLACLQMEGVIVELRYIREQMGEGYRLRRASRELQLIEKRCQAWIDRNTGLRTVTVNQKLRQLTEQREDRHENRT